MYDSNSYGEMQRAKMERILRDHEQHKVEQNRLPASTDYSRVLREWSVALTPAMRKTGWPLDLICAAAFANEPRRPATRFVAQALIKLGWYQHRDYSNAAGGRRYWFSPETIQSN